MYYIRDYNLFKIEELKKIMVKEVYCICIEIFDGKFVMFVGVYYLLSVIIGEE